MQELVRRGDQLELRQLVQGRPILRANRHLAQFAQRFIRRVSQAHIQIERHIPFGHFRYNLAGQQRLHLRIQIRGREVMRRQRHWIGDQL